MATLTLTLLRGEDLLAMDLNGKSDPYVVLTCGKLKFKSKVKKKTLNPEWDESFKFDIGNPSEDKITLKCWDKDTVTADGYLGECVLPVADLPRDKEKTLDLILTGEKERSDGKKFLFGSGKKPTGKLVVKVKANGFGK